MAKGLADGAGLIRAEEFTFALARHMPRPEAQAQMKALCKRAMAGEGALPDLVAQAFPDIDIDPTAGLGTAPDEARAFAAAVA